MQFVLTRSSVVNANAVSIGRVPRRTFGRGYMILPKGTILRPVFWRLLFEMMAFRYIITLLPFAIAVLVWPQYALPISQAPLAMFAAVYYVESYVLSYNTKEKRHAVVDQATAERALDALRVNGRRALGQLAAGRDLRDGPLHLVVEQSALARIAPFTLISVQRDLGTAEILDLTAQEQADLTRTLFADGLTEAALHKANSRENEFLRDIEFDPAQVSAHARMAALSRGLARKQG